MNIHWLLRMKRWVQNPPSPARIKLVFSVIAICIALALYEHFFGWPAFLTVNNQTRIGVPVLK